jgi:hypothetical protein
MQRRNRIVAATALATAVPFGASLALAQAELTALASFMQADRAQWKKVAAFAKIKLD